MVKRRWYALWLGLIMMIGVLGGCQMLSSGEVREVVSNDALFFQNPLNVTQIGDPFILEGSDGKFYLYATSDGDQGFKVWVSEDMVTWEEQIERAYTKTRESWGNGSFWAPEVYEWEGQYHMYYTANWKEKSSLRIGHATSDSPLGPFVDTSLEPMFDMGYAAIDGHVFTDNDGTRYFYYSRDCSENIVNGYHESHIYGVKLAADNHSFSGEPVLLTTPVDGWEIAPGDYRWNEGPFVVRVEDTYYMNYSANFYASRDYAVGYAIAKEPLGPFEKGEDSHLTYARETQTDISGSGHNMLLPIEGTNLFYTVYHTHTVPAIGGGDRCLNIGIVGIDAKGKMFSNAPHNSKQLKPEVFEKMLKFQSHYTVVDGNEAIDVLQDGNIALYPEAEKGKETYAIKANQSVRIHFNEKASIDSLILYSGLGEDRLESVDVTCSNGVQFPLAQFTDAIGDPISIAMNMEEVEWIDIKNSGADGVLSEIMVVPSQE